MNGLPAWQYDETKHPGIDYADGTVAARYDGNHQKFRDYRESAGQIISALGLEAEHTVIDLGCGTGAFALYAAPRCSRVHAVDVSAAMLDILRENARARGLGNIELHQAGFLTYEHRGGPADAVVSCTALHHLPDFWKLVALGRAARMLIPGGRLWLFDIVFPFGEDGYRAAFDRWVAGTREHGGEEMARETVVHIRNEYSTCDWILEGMLERSGFSIDWKHGLENVPGTGYLCTRR